MPTIEAALEAVEQAETTCYRSSGKRELERAVAKMRARADSYEAFLKALPDELSAEADEALWHLALRIPNP